MSKSLSDARPLLPGALILLVIANIVPEVLLQLADHGLVGPVWLRPLVYRLAAFQRDLISMGGPVFPGQTLLIFFTYGFVHTGILHLVVNMVGLVWLGRLLLAYRTTGTFVILYLTSMVGAAEMFALIGPPMGNITGASGAIFGLLGVYAIDHKFLPMQGITQPIWLQVVGIVLATAVITFADVTSQLIIDSSVAWQAHSGGFFTGALMALATPPRYK